MTRARGLCRDCHTDVLWVTLSDSGKRMPVDPYPDDRGNVAIRKSPVPGEWTAYVVSHDRPPAPGWKVVRSHMATCPKRRKEAPEREPEPTLF